MAIAARSFDSGTINLAANKPSSPLFTIDKGIGVIVIEGLIVRKPDIFARVLMGATDALEIGDAIREASERDDIKAVLLDIDSPGGTVAGTPELAAAVASLNNPHFPALRSGPLALSGASSTKQTPSSQLAISHALADFPLQGDYLARVKQRSKADSMPEWFIALTAHSLIHAGGVWLVTGSVTLAAVELLLHWLIDLGKGEGYYGYVADQVLHLACKVVYVIVLANGIQLS